MTWLHILKHRSASLLCVTGVLLALPGWAAAQATESALPRPPAAQAPQSPTAAAPAPLLIPPVLALPAPAEQATAAKEDESRISDEKLPLQLDGFPKRPKPLLELGSHFLGTGRIRKGFTIPGGAVWTPSFLMFGTLRSGVSTIRTTTSAGSGAPTRITQWANRLDLFGNLYLTASERVVVGVRPADETDALGVRRFSGYVKNSPAALTDGSINHFNFGWQTVSALFFEGDIGELFPFIDLYDRRGLDIGFSVGRQSISFQEGLLINDTIDAVGLTQTNFKPGGSINFRVTGLFAWNGINRHTPSSTALLQNSEAEGGRLFALFTELETRNHTMQFDAVYTRGNQFRFPCAAGSAAGCTQTVASTDGLYGGAGTTFRPGSGRVNVALRVVGSLPVGDEVIRPAAAVSDPATKGVLAFGEFSMTPHHSDNFFYVNAFSAFGRYRAAALDPTIPGPLARVGVSFAGPGLGNVPGALSAAANDAVGGAFGHQLFFRRTRQQLLLEVGGRFSTQSCVGTLPCDAHAFGGTARYQVAVGRRGVIVIDGFAARDMLRRDAGSRTRLGSRAELLVKF